MLKGEVADNLKYEFPPELPITSKVEEICRLWRENQLIIVCGATGSGKTTQLPKIAIASGFGRHGMIGCTQPRRLAACAMARREAEELNVACGEEVGYQVRFDDHTSQNTLIKFMTDGILLAETSNDRQLKKYDTIIIDEAHERSLNIDFLLGYLKHLMKIRPDLKIAISSATLDSGKFSEFFNQAPVIEVEGRMFPVEDVFMPPDSADEDLSEQLIKGVVFLSELDKFGDILVFLPGEREIHDCADALMERNFPQTEILMLYARLSGAEQQKVFKRSRLRRIILATNVAETSLTIPGIRFCIDSGQVRLSRYNPSSHVQELKIETVSQAGANQRRGRCGRTADGVCLHLYSENDLRSAPEYTDPEIKRTSLAGVILKMASLHLPRIDRFEFIDAPPDKLIREGVRTLEDIQALHPGVMKLTSDGWKLANIVLDPQLGKMVLSAARLKVLPEMLVITAFLSIQDPRERPLEKQAQSDLAHKRYHDEKSDFLAILNLWNAVNAGVESNSKGALRRFCQANFLNFNRMKEWRNLTEDLAENCREFDLKSGDLSKTIFENTPYDALHQAILSGIVRQVGQYVPEYQYYIGPTGRKYGIFPGSSLFKRKHPPLWLMSFSLMETSRLYGRCNAEILPEYIERIAPRLCRAIYENPVWNENNGFVYAKMRLTFGGLTIFSGKSVHYGKIDPVKSREIFIRSALVEGKLNIPGSWVARHVERLHELARLEIKLRRPESVIDFEAIYDHFNQVLPPDIFSTENLKKISGKNSLDYSMARDDMMQAQYHSFNEADYPDELKIGAEKYDLVYYFDPGTDNDGVFMYVDSADIEFLPHWTFDFLPTGYLREKVEIMLRNLPKNLRQKLFPLAECAKTFVQGCESGLIFSERPLKDSLCEFLCSHYEIELFPRDFDGIIFPEFLKLKIYEVGEFDRIVKVWRELPEHQSGSSKISGASIRSAKNLIRTGLLEWPENLDLPLQADLGGGKTAYPGLIDEETSVGCGLFLQKNESNFQHCNGILRLFELKNLSQIRFVRKKLTFPREMLLAWFTQDTEKTFISDLINCAILESLTPSASEIRNFAAFKAASARAVQFFAGNVDEKMSGLNELLILYEKLYNLIKKIERSDANGAEELQLQLDFLFRKGFLKSPVVWSDYKRYLRGLQIRAERMMNSPAKDVEKSLQLADWLEKFHLALQTVPEITQAPELYEFWLLLEECRIAIFAPEVRPKYRTPLTQLADLWKTLHF